MKNKARKEIHIKSKRLYEAIKHNFNTIEEDTATWGRATAQHKTTGYEHNWVIVYLYWDNDKTLPGLISGITLAANV